MIFTACETGGELDEHNNGNQTEQPGSGDQGGGDIPADAYIGLNKDAVTISPDGGSVDVTVYSNYKWTLSTSCDWCTASMSGGEANEDGVVVTLSADVAYDDREATFLFSCGNAKKVLIVSQKFKEAIIADENNTFNVPAEGGVVEIAYQTTVECEVVIPQNAQSWISITPETRALVSEKATLTVAENTTYSDREAVVKVVKVGDNTLFAEYTISQVQNDAIIAENNTLNVGGWQQNATIQYQTNVECEVVIPDDCKEWISVVPETRALSRNSVTLDFADNNTGAERKGVVQVVAINNKELVAEYSVTQNQRYFIEYTTNNGNIVNPSISGVVANRYEKGVGYIDFNEPVTSIGDYAFYWCTSLTSVTIPDSVTSIGERAFYNCTSLTSITIGNSVTSIGDYAFYKCTSLTSVTIGNGVTSIGGSAFRDCTSLTSVTIGNSVTSIGGEAFSGCSSLTRVDITDLSAWCKISFGSYNANPLYYAKKLYLNGSELTDITIPSGITEIKAYAFYKCTSLTSITIPDSVTSIGKYAFRDCTSLTSVTIPDGVTSIGEVAFQDCTSLKRVDITDLSAWCKMSFGNPSANPLSNGAKLHLNGSELTDITIPSDITEIKAYAFYKYTSLTSVTIPDGVTSIGKAAFEKCSSLTSITIGNSVTEIGDWAFDGCTFLKRVDITDLSAWCKISFGYTYANPLCYGAKLYLNGSELTDITIPSDITEIKDYAFYNCTSLTSITIPDSVTSIGGSAFYWCTSLTSITIPDSVTLIGSKAFYRCYSLTSVTIGNSVTSIGEYAFYECDSLTSVTIPDSVTSIGNNAFEDCTSLKEVYCKPTTPPAGGAYMFRDNASVRKIYVPRNSVSAYKSASRWSSYASDIVGYDF